MHAYVCVCVYVRASDFLCGLASVHAPPPLFLFHYVVVVVGCGWLECMHIARGAIITSSAALEYTGWSIGDAERLGKIGRDDRGHACEL